MRGAIVGLCLLLGTLPARAEPSCPPGQEFYWGECRPAPRCEPGCFPQAIACRSRPVLRGYDPPWSKFLDRKRWTVPLYDKRLDRRGLAQEHISYIPDLDLAAGMHLSPSWKPSFVGIRLSIDEGADGTLDRVYDLEIFAPRVYALFYSALPKMIVAARSESDPLSYVYGRLEAFSGTDMREPSSDDRAGYAALLEMLDAQMCR